MDSIEYAQRVAAKVRVMLEAGDTRPWSQKVRDAGDEVMKEADEKGVHNAETAIQ